MIDDDSKSGDYDMTIKIFQKSSRRVERGFRFLKDPEFFADSIFLSKNERIQSLFRVMTLSLAVFSGLEWKLQNKKLAQN